MVALLVALAGAALFRFLSWRDPVAEAQRKLWATRSLRYEVAIDFVGAFEDATSTVVTARVRTDADLRDPAVPASASAFELRAEAGGEVSSLAGETRRIGGEHWLKLAKATGAYARAAEPVVDRWASDDAPLLERILPGAARIPAAPAFGLLREGAVPTIGAVLRGTASLGLERSGARALSRHRVVAPSGGEIPALFEYAARTSQGLEKLPADDERALRAIVAAWGSPVGEAWIDARTGRFAKIVLASQVSGERVRGVARATVVFSREGAPVAVDRPVDARDLDELLAGGPDKHLSLAGERLRDERPAGAEAPGGIASSSGRLTDPGKAKDSDGDGLIDTQEFFYGSDAWNPDTDADGWNDGDEVKKGRDPAGAGALFGFGL